MIFFLTFIWPWLLTVHLLGELHVSLEKAQMFFCLFFFFVKQYNHFYDKVMQEYWLD